MAGPGGGPPRRSHTKSRKGCETCKRRHIRCDENFPQCRNCTKHSVRCPYMDMPVAEERASSPERPDLLWTPEVETQILLWQQTGEFPFPDLNIFPTPSPHFLTFEELRLIHHIASISMDLNMQDASSFTIWTSKIPLFISIGTNNSFVMHALLALSATHIAWLTDCPMVKQMAYRHHGESLVGLREAIGVFSRESSDAVLAASLLLSWQASEWRSWTQLMYGTSSVMDAVQPWKFESQFEDFMAEQPTFPTASSSSPLNARRSSHFRQVDLDALQHAYGQLKRVEAVLVGAREDTKAIVDLASFVECVSKASPSQTPAQRFDMLTPLRTWLFWLPVMHLQRARDNPYALVVVAYYYTVALVVEPIFPDIGAAYFGSLSLQPIEEIARRLFSIGISRPSDQLQASLALIEYPIDMVAMFRRRLGWKQPQRTDSVPRFRWSGYSINVSEAPGFHPTDNLGSDYAQKHPTCFTSDLQSALATGSEDSFPTRTQYLNICTTPAFVQDYQSSSYQISPYQSPAYQQPHYQSPVSSYVEVARNDQHIDDYNCMTGYGTQAIPTSSFAGFVQPHTIWI